MIKRIVTFSVIVLLSFRLSYAVEGMWLPMLLEQLNEDEMTSMGMRISAEDIYSINKSSLKDAILLFGRGCTAEIISDQGLILTNHHCGYGQIQRHSSVENDYLTKGFWAMDKSQELVNPGLSVTLLVRMEDVTARALNGVKAGITEKERADLISSNIKTIEEEAIKGTAYGAKVRPFYYGNQYYLFITETFNDVRLVGAPPSSIGKFGGDTDNWMWPRHTGDFSLFRIYVNKNNEPADYSPDNVPYKPKNHLPVSLKGVEENDFTFVFGYPGRTQEYLPSFAVDLISNHKNPAAIRLREQRLDIFDEYMNQSDLVRIQYSAKHAGVANFWKKMIGESRGINRLDAVTKKQNLQEEFKAWALADAERSKKYSSLIAEFEKTYNQLLPYSVAETYLQEAGFSVEAIGYALRYRKLVEAGKANASADEINNLVKQLQDGVSGFYKYYHQPLDRKVFAAMLNDWASNQPINLTPVTLRNQKYKSYKEWADNIYGKTFLSDSNSVRKILNNYKARDYKKIEKDPLYKLGLSFFDYYQTQVMPVTGVLSARLDSLQRLYMQALMEFQPNKRFFPDANSTLRVSYGKVDGYTPMDAVNYGHYTTLNGIIEKDALGVYDYVVEPRLKEPFKDKNYGQYAAPDGTMRVAFIASNHTTGGNSGSPVLNADGHLVGLNFDRNWEGTMSDLIYDPDQCKNISLDIRYCLFVIDKYAGAGHLVNEMTIIR